MKIIKDHFVPLINCILVGLIVINLTAINVTKDSIKVQDENKEISTQVFASLTTVEKVIEEEIVEEIEQVVEPIVEQPKEEKVQEENASSNIQEEIIIEEEKNNEEVLEALIGSISGYGPDCRGCSGYTASGYDVYGKGIYYNDSTYGKVRIVAGDKKYPFGTIVRIKNTKFSSEPILAIVLDRGGSIGIDKTHTFDLLYESESLTQGISKNVTFEILRLGGI